MWAVLIAQCIECAHSTALWRRRMRQWRCNVRLGTWLYPLCAVRWYAVYVAWARALRQRAWCMNNCKQYYCFIRHGYCMFSLWQNSSRAVFEVWAVSEHSVFFGKSKQVCEKIMQFCQWLELRWNMRRMLSFQMSMLAACPSTRLTSNEIHYKLPLKLIDWY